MNTLISGTFVVALTIFAVVALDGSHLAGTGVFAGAERQATLDRADRLHSSTRITSTSATPSGGGTAITVTAANSGSIPSNPAGSMEVLVRYVDASGTLVITRLGYVPGAPGANEWTIASISPDAVNPGMWDPSEAAIISLQVQPAAAAGTSGTVVVVTGSAASDSAYFLN